MRDEHQMRELHRFARIVIRCQEAPLQILEQHVHGPPHLALAASCQLLQAHKLNQ